MVKSNKIPNWEKNQSPLRNNPDCHNKIISGESSR